MRLTTGIFFYLLCLCIPSYGTLLSRILPSRRRRSIPVVPNDLDGLRPSPSPPRGVLGSLPRPGTTVEPKPEGRES